MTGLIDLDHAARPILAPVIAPPSSSPRRDRTAPP
jgi:hypothetical protein